jgi:hypothetical protein
LVVPNCIEGQAGRNGVAKNFNFEERCRWQGKKVAFHFDADEIHAPLKGFGSLPSFI